MESFNAPDQPAQPPAKKKAPLMAMLAAMVGLAGAGDEAGKGEPVAAPGGGRAVPAAVGEASRAQIAAKLAEAEKLVRSAKNFENPIAVLDDESGPRADGVSFENPIADQPDGGTGNPRFENPIAGYPAPGPDSGSPDFLNPLADEDSGTGSADRGR